MVPAMIMGGASLAGGLMSNLFTDKRQKKAQEFNAEQAQKQMDFQERMSSSAYQRSMKDMKAAGLNPILAYQKGPASSPTGAMASTDYKPFTDVVTPAVSTAVQSYRARHEVENMVETNKNLQEQNKNLQAERVRIGAQVGSISADTAIKTELLQNALRDAARSKTDEAFYKHPVGKFMRTLGVGLKELNPFGSINVRSNVYNQNPYQ